MTLEQIAQEIRAHALQNYNKGGWDFIVECWTIELIVDELEYNGISDRTGALKYYKRTAKLCAEQRRAVEAEIW